MSTQPENFDQKKHAQTMKRGKSIAVWLANPDGSQETPGEIRVRFWNQKERSARALKFGAMCWGAALVAVFIPLLHFFLVPALLMAGPILAYFVRGQESVILGGEGKCPSCAAFFPVARALYNFPVSDVCSACQSSVKIDLERST